MMSTTGSIGKSLFVFIDESGNFDFGPNGTGHFVMAGIATLYPADSANEIHKLRYALMEEGFDVTYFHATEDRQIVRNKVFETIGDLRLIEPLVVSASKNRLPKDMQDGFEMHGVFAQRLLEAVLEKFRSVDFESIVIIFDQAIPSKQQGVFHKKVKPVLKQFGKPFHLYFQKIGTDPNGQISDYFAWSKYVSLERNEFRPWDFVTGKIEIIDISITGAS